MNEQYYDAILNIKTVGEQKGFNKSLHYHRYEPTPYSGLEILLDQYEMKSSDRIVDFGCGKGRLNFYIHHACGASAVGIEMNEMFYKEAMENLERYAKKSRNSKDKIQFQCCLAQEYEIDPRDNRFYFFNPFSVQVFMNVINNILLSVEEVEREIEIILYYPSEDYIFFLENQTAFELKEEVRLPGVYERNGNERFLVYGLRS
ncbi:MULTISPECIES: class I SAM-dependent methyltransferase [Bacillus]|uniref:class I SAM-dependent methyltransferase n=1 Tax=Bacillus TaxID=1386 RepID=UPI0001A14968|nr:MULTISPECIES: class I SAM-dependent methyltransferase [Bacillus cereus group]EEM18807.1 Methyltransferase [Bacillus pseudomycoides DSM 12442]MBJ8026827.1 class I SAM-dependent methyltransferase [Bacillus cereus group sp. N21]MEB3056333.1 class I SAM-dependent methyltransferase [Bacillus pseudomycoides]MED1598484.1 class I SAM-dependent methyltransferase [Bacillus pseudomycoides]MED4712768.1 class I SAM-dependent methyltransferase [Bacillus pseudomycoides]